MSTLFTVASPERNVVGSGRMVRVPGRMFVVT